MTANVFALPGAATAANVEFIETLLAGEGKFRIERIISHGHVTPEGTWYDQEEDEWVIVLHGNAGIGYPDGTEQTLNAGDACFLPKHVQHRVAWTSSPCVWLAVFGEDIIAPGGGPS